MNRHALSWRTSGALALGAALLVAPLGFAQDDEDEEIFELSPFTVEGSQDSGYSATSTLAGTRIRTDVKDLATPISIITEQFLKDTAATNNADLLVYTPSTEVMGIRGNLSGQGGTQNYQEENLGTPNTNTRVRGLDRADNTRDYFITDIPWDSYNVGRVDMQRGPNSILFGLGSPAGIINASVKAATYTNENEIGVRIDGENSLRFTGDFNRVLIEDELAIRVSFLNEDTKYKQKPAFKEDERYFAAVKWEPKLFGDNRTTIRANYEKGDIMGNNPRALPPVDYINPWFYSLDKLTVDPGRDRERFTVNDGDDPKPWFPNEAFKGSQFSTDPTPIYSQPYTTFPDGTTYTGQRTASFGYNVEDGAVTESLGGIGDQIQFRNFAIAGFYQYASAGSGIPDGGSFYGDFSMQDPTVFDFYNKLLDGDNKREWQEWDSSNVAISQSMLNDRLNFEAVYDHQDYLNGNSGSGLNGRTYGIQIDINTHNIDGSENENLGRPYVASAGGFGGGGWNTSVRDSYRYTLVGEVQGTDIFGDSKLGDIVGRHIFTAIAANDTTQRQNTNWRGARMSTDWNDAVSTNQLLATDGALSYDWTVYLGDSLLGANTPKNANISNIQGTLQAPSTLNVNYFDSHWNAPDVDPTAPYTYYNYLGEPQESTQSENSANYVGWVEEPFRVLSPGNGDIAELYGAGQKTRLKTDSEAITWQGYLFGGDLVPVFGWRKDKVTNSATQGPQDDRAVGTPNFPMVINEDNTRSESGQSRSWGVVAHLPDFLAEKLPGNSNLSVFYNYGENFSASAPRADVRGNILPNPSAETDDYGFVFRTMEEKLSFKVNWYKTTMQNAALSGTSGAGGFGGAAYYLWAIPTWGISHAIKAYEGLAGRVPSNDSSYFNYAANDDDDYEHGDDFRPGVPAFENHPSTIALKAALADYFANQPLDQGFFDNYGTAISVAGLQSSDPTTAYVNGWNPTASLALQPAFGGRIASVGQNATAVADTISKGQEFEILAQPIPNWNISINASKTFATIDNISPTVTAFIDEYTDFLAGPAGDIRMWGGNSGNTMRNYWQNNILNAWGVLQNRQGQQVPEMAEWRYNTVSSFRFADGALKNVLIGGAWRHEGKKIIGYAYDPSISSLDVSKPYYSTPTNHLDLWLGYSKELSDSVDWSIQLNVRNVGEDDHLVAATKNPDGQTSLYRIQEGMGWQLSNTFNF